MFFRKAIRWYKLFESRTAAEQMLAKGKVCTLEVNRKRICFVHAEDGFYAMNDRCPHNGASLGNGYCTAEGSVVCPVHRYHFDLKTGRAKSGLGDAVRTFPVEVRENGVFVGFEETRWKFF
jgi:nitrite reductase/ring-hydroxylating ferredoxin subunit